MHLPYATLRVLPLRTLRGSQKGFHDKCTGRVQWRGSFGNQEIRLMIQSHGVMDVQNIKGLTSLVVIKWMDG